MCHFFLESASLSQFLGSAAGNPTETQGWFCLLAAIAQSILNGIVRICSQEDTEMLYQELLQQAVEPREQPDPPILWSDREAWFRLGILCNLRNF